MQTLNVVKKSYAIDRYSVLIENKSQQLRCVEIYSNGNWYAALQRFDGNKWVEIPGSREKKTFEEILKLREQISDIQY